MTVAGNRVGRNRFGTGGRFTTGDISRMGFNAINRSSTACRFVDEAPVRSIWTPDNSANVYNETGAGTSGTGTLSEGLGNLSMVTGGNNLKTPWLESNRLTGPAWFMRFFVFPASSVGSRGYFGIADTGTAATTIIAFGSSLNGRPLVVVSDGTTRSVIIPAASPSMTANIWQELAAELYNGTVTLYLNGAIAATGAFAGFLNWFSGAFLTFGDVGEGVPATGTSWDVFQYGRYAPWRGTAYTSVPRFI